MSEGGIDVRSGTAVPLRTRLAAVGAAMGLVLLAAPAAWVAARPPLEVGIAPAPLEPAAAPPAHGASDAGRERRELTRGPRLVFEAHPARLEDHRVPQRLAPRVLTLPALGVQARIVPVGVEDGTGALELPSDARRIGWYRFGALPGEPGTAVIAAHVDWAGEPAAFFELRRLRRDHRVVVTLGGGRKREFAVVARSRYDKGALPPRLFARTGPPMLALVTCAGRFDEERRTYEDNLVVWARPL